MFGFLRNLRKPKPSRINDERVWNANWEVGDLAECIFDFPPCWSFNPKKGDVLRVSYIRDDIATDGMTRAYFLHFYGKPAHCGWATIAFRKLKTVQEPASAAFTAEIRRLGKQPVRV